MILKDLYDIVNIDSIIQIANHSLEFTSKIASKTMVPDLRKN